MAVDDSRLAAAVPAWSPARQRLAARIARRDDALCRSVEACFAGLAAAVGEDAIGPDVTPIADALVAAARAVTFGETAADRRAPGHPHRFGAVPTRPEGPLLPTGVHPLVAPWSAANRAAPRSSPQKLRETVSSSSLPAGHP